MRWNVEQVMFYCMLFGVTTIDAFKSKLYSPISDALKSASIRVAVDDNEIVLNGIVPGVFHNILNLYLEADYKHKDVVKLHQQFERAFHESVNVPEIGDYPYAMSEPLDNGGWVDGVQPCWTGTAFYKSKFTGATTFDGTHDPEEFQKTFKGVSKNVNFYDSTQYELMDEVANVYNRLVLFNAKRIHAATKYFGDEIENARFFQLFFFDVE